MPETKSYKWEDYPTVYTYTEKGERPNLVWEVTKSLFPGVKWFEKEERRKTAEKPWLPFKAQKEYWETYGPQLSEEEVLEWEMRGKRPERLPPTPMEESKAVDLLEEAFKAWGWGAIPRHLVGFVRKMRDVPRALGAKAIEQMRPPSTPVPKLTPSTPPPVVPEPIQQVLPFATRTPKVASETQRHVEELQRRMREGVTPPPEPVTKINTKLHPRAVVPEPIQQELPLRPKEVSHITQPPPSPPPPTPTPLPSPPGVARYLSPIEAQPKVAKELTSPEVRKYDKLFDEALSRPLPPSPTLLGKGKKLAKGAKFEAEAVLTPPSWLFRQEPTGRGWELFTHSQELLKKINHEKSLFFREFADHVKVKRNTREARTVGFLLDRYEKFEDIPPEVLKELKVTPEIEETFRWMRLKWEDFRLRLESVGIKLPDQRITSYFHHTWGPDDLRYAWQAEKEVLEQTALPLAREKGRTQAVKKMEERLNRLNEAIDTFDRRGIVLYNVLPRHIDAEFLHKRKGAPGYTLDAVTAMLKYHDRFVKKLYHEPFLNLAADLAKGMSSEWKNYSVWYAKRFVGFDKLQTNPLTRNLDAIERTLTTLEYIKDLGFLNFRSAIVNLTQNLNTIAETGGKTWAEAIRFAYFDPKGKQLWEASGHALDVPQIYWGYLQKGLSNAQAAGTYIFNKVELFNRKVAYAAGYLEAIKSGASEVEALRHAEDVITRTQFVYGVLGMPKGFGSVPGSKLGFQYSTFTINEMKLLQYWWEHDKRALLTFILLSTGVGGALDYLGVDLNATITLFGNPANVVRGFVDVLSGDERKKAKGKARLLTALPRTALTPYGTGGSGVFPTTWGFPAIETMQSLYRVTRDLISHGTADYNDLRAITPAQPLRVWEMVDALVRGKAELPEYVKGVRAPEEGYVVAPVMGRQKGHPSHTFSLPELIIRTFLSRTVKETEEEVEAKSLQLLNEMSRDVHRRILELRQQGRYEEAERLIDVWGAVAPQIMKDERLREMTTPSQRRKSEYRKFRKRGWEFESEE